MSWLAILLLSASANASEQSDLRYRLETLYNEVDLAIRNKRSDESGIARLDRAMSALRVTERIPMRAELEGLKAELSKRASEAGVKLISLKLTSSDHPSQALPRELVSDTPKFSLSPNQIAQTLHLRITVSGDGPAIEQWVQKWPEDQLRLIEPESGYARPGLEPAGPGRFQLRAKAYRFRHIRFPKLKPRDPIQVLPSWARRDLAGFAQEEPMLWNFVRRIREKIPDTVEPFQKKGDLLLSEARMSFFLSKAK